MYKIFFKIKFQQYNFPKHIQCDLEYDFQNKLLKINFLKYI